MQYPSKKDNISNNTWFMGKLYSDVNEKPCVKKNRKKSRSIYILSIFFSKQKCLPRYLNEFEPQGKQK